jgi:hypothetical protein
MNDYLAKPIMSTALVAMLDKWTGGTHQTKDHGQGEVPADLGDEFLARCARDLARVKLLLASNSPQALEELRKVAHDVAGTGTMAGYPSLSANADGLSEKLLHANGSMDPSALKRSRNWRKLFKLREDFDGVKSISPMLRRLLMTQSGNQSLRSCHIRESAPRKGNTSWNLPLAVTSGGAWLSRTATSFRPLSRNTRFTDWMTS